MGGRGASVAQWYRAGLLLVKRSSDRSYTRGMIHSKIHLISPDVPGPVYLTVQNRGLKHLSFIHCIPGSSDLEKRLD